MTGGDGSGALLKNNKIIKRCERICGVSGLFCNFTASIVCLSRLIDENYMLVPTDSVTKTVK